MNNTVSEVDLKDWRSSEWNTFFSNFNAPLRALAASYNLNDHDVDDVVQEILVAMAKQFQKEKFDSIKGSLFAWVMKFAKWRMIDVIRSNKVKQKYFVSDDAAAERYIDDRFNMDKKYESDHQVEVVLAAMNSISNTKSKEYRIFYDMFVNNMEIEDVMEKHDASRTSVYLSKCRMLKKIKAEMMRIDPSYNFYDC